MKEIKKKYRICMDMSKKDNSNDVIEKEDEKGGHSGSSIWPKPVKNKIL